MEKEYETQVIDIEVAKVRRMLRKLGAAKEPEVLQKRWVFDLDPCTTTSTGEWVRLRQAGDKKPTITYKNKTGKSLDQTSEIEIEVDNFERAAALLAKLNFKGQYYQENKRERFTYNNIEFTLDTWPMIPTYLEIEAKSAEKVREGLKMLDLEKKDEGHLGTLAIYKKYGINLHDITDLRFKQRK